MRPAPLVRSVAWSLLMLALPPGVAPVTAQPRGRPASVVVLSPMSSRAPTAVAIEEGVRSALEAEAGEPVEIRVEYLDILDAPRTPYLDRVLDLLRDKYRDIPVDVVIAHRMLTLDLTLRHRAVFHDAPAVFVEISRDAAEPVVASASEVTGTVVEYDLNAILGEALDLVPRARQVFIVGGASAFDRAFVSPFTDALRAHPRGVGIVSLVGLPLDEQLQRVAALPADALVMIPSYRADARDRPYRSEDVVPRIARASSVPTFGFAEAWLGSGIIGGSLVQFDVQGERAGRLAAQILRGRPASSLPLVSGPLTLRRFDARALARWGIPESSLPAGSQVLFREPSLWNDYRWWILGASAFVLGQAFLIVALLDERRRRRGSQAAREVAEQRYRTVAESTAELVYWMLPDGSFQYVSPSCARVTGYAAEELLEHPGLIQELIIPDDRKKWTDYRQSVRSATTPLETEIRIRTRSGEPRWIEVTEAPVMGPDGASLGVRGSARDVSDRKRSEADLRGAFGEIERLRDQLEIDNTLLRQEVARTAGIDGILGSSDVMGYVVTKVRQVAPTSSTVLLLGETGVGKSRLARAIHDLSPRRERPFVTLDCASLPPSLIETELFGHERGAFTGAHARRVGRFEAANGGTLLLDEIGELPLDLQGKLLRAVQDGAFERVGSSVPIRTDLRLIAATNADLEARVRAGRFRQDLWYRLNVFPLSVPPLRQRRDDIPLLTAHLIDKHCQRLGRPPVEVTRADMKWLQAQPWPGNVRELEAFVERCLIQSPGARLDISGGQEAQSTMAIVNGNGDSLTAALSLEEVERRHIVATLERLEWRVSGAGGAAAALRMNASTLRSRMDKLGIIRPGKRQAAPP